MTQGLVQATTSDVQPGCDHPSAEAWAARITECWRSGVEAIIRTGHLLNQAKASLPHGGWGEVLSRLPFGERRAQMLMAIASDIRLSNPQRIALLPPSWPTIYDLTRLDDDDLDRGFRERIIHPDMEREDVELIRPARAIAPPRIAQPMSDEEIDAGEPSSIRPLSNAEMKESGDASLMEGSPAPMPSGGLAIAHRREEGDGREFFPTPPWATRALIERVFVHLKRDGHCKWQKAWEPASGEGHMVEPLREYFKEVIASDLYQYNYGGEHPWDFLADDLPKMGNDWIITNPPFKTSTAFALKALERAGTGVALFVRLSWLEGLARYEKIFRDNPPTVIAPFVERVPLHKGRWEEDGVTMTAYAWLVWIKGFPPQPVYWIPPGCREALSKPEDIKKFGKSIAEDEAA